MMITLSSVRRKQPICNTQRRWYHTDIVTLVLWYNSTTTVETREKDFHSHFSTNLKYCPYILFKNILYYSTYIDLLLHIE